MTYVDDIILTSKTPEELRSRLLEFLKLCRYHNIVLKRTKSNLMRKEDIKILGFSIRDSKLYPQHGKLDQLEITLKDLKTQKDLRALVASLNYYRCFSPRFSFLAQPLFDSLKLDKKEFAFTDVHKEALKELVHEIRKTEGLSFLNDKKIKNGKHTI